MRQFQIAIRIFLQAVIRKPMTASSVNDVKSSRRVLIMEHCNQVLFNSKAMERILFRIPVSAYSLFQLSMQHGAESLNRNQVKRNKMEICCGSYNFRYFLHRSGNGLTMRIINSPRAIGLGVCVCVWARELVKECLGVDRNECERLLQWGMMLKQRTLLDLQLINIRTSAYRRGWDDQITTQNLAITKRR